MANITPPRGPGRRYILHPPREIYYTPRIYKATGSFGCQLATTTTTTATTTTAGQRPDTRRLQVRKYSCTLANTVPSGSDPIQSRCRRKKNASKAVATQLFLSAALYRADVGEKKKAPKAVATQLFLSAALCTPRFSEQKMYPRSPVLKQIVKPYPLWGGQVFRFETSTFWLVCTLLT